MDLQALGQYITASQSGVTATVALDELSLTATPQNILALLQFLRDDAACAFTILVDICGVDWPQRIARFDVVYHLLSITQNKRIRVKLQVDENTAVPSANDLFMAANWFEREAYDMYGIQFDNHPDMRRLLTDYGFSGYPLRKDFPLTGFVEVRYDEELKRVVYQPVQLVQEFRDFDFMSPWEGARHIIPGDEKASTDKAGAPKEPK